MRLGTKSCAECRRRKICCIFNDGDKSCTACQLHNTECEAQGIKTNTPKAADFDEIKIRLERLELLMDKVCDAADLKDGSKPNDLEASMSTLIDRLCAERGRASPVSLPRKDLASHERLEPDDFTDVSSKQATGAPLMKFIQATSIIAEAESPNTGSECDLMTNVSKADIYRILPSSSEVVQILEATSIYWPLWPLRPSQLSPSTNLSLSAVTIARSFIEESIESGRPADMTRALMWFALCVQQVPSSDIGNVASRKMASSAAVMRYLHMSDVLLGPDVQTDFTTAGLICLVLQAKCYVNMGRQSIWDRDVEARKWQSIRGLISELKVAPTLLDHTVARQAAQLLEYLDSARNGTYIGPDAYDAVIPYFGKVRIRRPQARNSPAVDGPRAEPPDVAGMATFDSDIYDFTVPTGLIGNELDTDWESFLKGHATYDWSGVFEF
ncbi:hypothetical protein LQW54_004248 [Pestalotiopsis sp. IQ-011]